MRRHSLYSASACRCVHKPCPRRERKQVESSLQCRASLATLTANKWPVRLKFQGAGGPGAIVNAWARVAASSVGRGSELLSNDVQFPRLCIVSCNSATVLVQAFVPCLLLQLLLLPPPLPPHTPVRITRSPASCSPNAASPGPRPWSGVEGQCSALFSASSEVIVCSVSAARFAAAA